MVGVQGLIPALLAAGAIASADAVRRSFELVPIGRSHPVFRLDLDGEPYAAVKLFGERRGETDGEAAREAAVLALGGSLPALADLLPTVLVARPGDGLFVTGWFDGAPAWEGDAVALGSGGSAAADLEALALRVVAPLAALHRTSARHVRDGTLDAALAGPCPWILRTFDGDGSPELWRHPTVAPVLARAGASPALVAGLRRARGAWRAVALIHGDLKHDNLLVRRDGRIVLVDWEMARVGDPAWDLAGLMTRPLLAAEGPAWGDAEERAARRMLAAYAASSRLPLAALAQRLVLYCGAWLLMSALQARSVAAQPDDDATQHVLDRATACFTDCDRIVENLARTAHGS